MDKKENSFASPKMGLNKNHISSISTTLSLVERDLDELERYIKHTPQGRMHEIINDLEPGQEESILNKIKSIKEDINDFADILNLEPYQDSLSKLARANLSIRWVDVRDLEAKNLKCYGPVGEEGAEFLDIHVQKITKLLNELLSYLDKK